MGNIREMGKGEVKQSETSKITMEKDGNGDKDDKDGEEKVMEQNNFHFFFTVSSFIVLLCSTLSCSPSHPYSLISSTFTNSSIHTTQKFTLSPPFCFFSQSSNPPSPVFIQFNTPLLATPKVHLLSQTVQQSTQSIVLQSSTHSSLSLSPYSPFKSRFTCHFPPSPSLYNPEVQLVHTVLFLLPFGPHPHSYSRQSSIHTVLCPVGSPRVQLPHTVLYSLRTCRRVNHPQSS